MSPPVLRAFEVAADFFASALPSTPIVELRAVAASLPFVSSSRFPELLQLSQDRSPEKPPSGFDVIQLFTLARGSKWIHTARARDLWLSSFCSCTRVALEYDGQRDDTVVCKTRSKGLIVQKGAMPDAEVPDPITSAAALLNVVNKGVTNKTYMGPFNREEAIEKFGVFIASEVFGIEDTTRSTTKIRLIHNLSSRLFSVNDFVSGEFSHTLDYTKMFFAALSDIAATTPAVWFGCLDISRGYRRFRTRHQDIPMQGLNLPILSSSSVPFFDGDTTSTRHVAAGDELFWFDVTMPFGSRSAPRHFCAVSIAVRDIVREIALNAGVPGSILCYVDDFAALAPTKEAASFFMATLRSLLLAIGLPEEPSKAQPVSTTIRYLGVDYDGELCTATLPQVKRELYIRYLSYFVATTRRIKWKHLDQVVHRLRHAASVLRAGKPFFSSLLQTLRSRAHGSGGAARLERATGLRHGRVQHRGAYIKLSSTDKDDMRWWIHILSHHPPMTVIGPDHWITAADASIYTDASKLGFGAFFNGRWFNGSFTPTEIAAFEAQTVTINEFELLAVVFAISTWAHLLTARRILFYCDNSASVASVTTQQSRVPVRSALLRHLYAIAAIHSIDLKIVWLGTKTNIIADALSRFDIPLFQKITQDRFMLHHENEPALASRLLLFDPAGPQNPSSPEWRP